MRRADDGSRAMGGGTVREIRSQHRIERWGKKRMRVAGKKTSGQTRLSPPGKSEGRLFHRSASIVWGKKFCITPRRGRNQTQRKPDGTNGLTNLCFARS
jgi:hypothetical protein